MTKFALGQSVPRVEDDALLRGAGRYTDDFALKDALHACIVRSPHAHARIKGIATEEAAKAPGVVAVLTGKHVEADGLGTVPCLIPIPGLKEPPRHVLALHEVRHVGDPVALVVAQTLAQAKDAADKVEVDYEVLPAVTDTRQGEVAFEVGMGSDAAKVDAALKASARVVRLELVNNRLVANPIEPRAALAEYDAASGRTTLYTPSQGPHHVYGQIADQVVKTGREKLRVVSGNVGGAFGMKIFLYPEQPMMVWAARRLKRTVRWTGERSEAFLSDAQGRDNVTHVELGLDADARFTALRVTTWANMGGYLSNFGPFIPQLAGPVLSGVYAIKSIHLKVIGTLTNTVPVDAYRGAGRPEAIYLLERVVDVAARELAMAPDELRRRNFIKPSEMPWQTPVESRYDSGDFATIMEKALAKADWKNFPKRKNQAGKRRGIGMAMYIERCGGGPGDTIRVEVKDNEVRLYSGMQDNGQGHATTFVQLMSQRFGIDAEKIRVVQGDTDIVPAEGLTGGSRFLAIGGVAANAAADEVIEQGRKAAAAKLEASAADIEYRDGEFRIAGTDRRVSLFDVGDLSRTHTRTPPEYTYPNGCHVCEVEVDPDTGAVRIVGYTVVDDFGRAMNPLLLEGQVHGGSVQGIGQALLEHAVYDPASGQLLSGSFMDYAMPRAGDMPSFHCGFHGVPCTTNPLGVKGAGEAGAVGAPPAVINAIADALGVSHIDMPATPERIWLALKGA
jgi:carbon-monoxide dehydrogenase large subunit